MVLTRWKHGQSSRQRKHRPASTAPQRYKATRRRLAGDSQEGLNRRSTRNLIHTYRGGCRGNTGQLDKDSTVKDTGQLIGRGDTSLVNKKGGSWSPSTGPGLQPPPTRHGRPVIRRLLQVTRNGNWQQYRVFVKCSQLDLVRWIT